MEVHVLYLYLGDPSGCWGSKLIDLNYHSAIIDVPLM